MSDDITRAVMFRSDNTITTFSFFRLFLLLCYIFHGVIRAGCCCCLCKYMCRLSLDKKTGDAGRLDVYIIDNI